MSTVNDDPGAVKQALGSLSPEKLAALQQRLLKKPRAKSSSIPKYPVLPTYPLSFHQRRLWFIERLQPDTPIYNVSRAIRMRGPLDRKALFKAMQSIVDRHQALRTTFHEQAGEPYQRVESAREFLVETRDLSSLPEDQLPGRLSECLTQESRRLFNLTGDLMLRAVLYEIDESHHVLQVTIHHIACDGTTLTRLFAELKQLYAAFKKNFRLDPTEILPAIDLQYTDFCQWQHETKQIARFEQQTEWWKERLAGAPTTNDIALDRPRPPRESGQGALIPLEMPLGLREQLEDFSRARQATLFMTLLSGFCILISRYTGRDDFLIGTATAGRNHSDLQSIFGFFVDTIALRIDTSGNPSASEMVERTRNTLLRAMEHSDVPFDRVVNAMDVPRDLSRSPLIQVLFNAPPQYTLELEDLDVSPLHVDTQSSRLDLEFTWSEGANRQTGITYNTDIYEAETIRQMCDDYILILQEMVSDPGCRLDALAPEIVAKPSVGTFTLDEDTADEILDFVEPQAFLEQQLAEIWIDVLGLSKIGIHDNFFSLGGHSLLAMRVAVRIRETILDGFSVRSLFEHPTIASLSLELEKSGCQPKEESQTKSSDVLTTIPVPDQQPAGIGTTATASSNHVAKPEDRYVLGEPLSSAQQRAWFLEQLEGELVAYNIRVVWRIKGRLDIDALKRAFLTVVQRHEPLRTVYLVEDGEPFQVVRDVESLDMPIEDVSGAESKTEFIEQKCRELGLLQFDLKADIMLRAHLLKIHNDDHVLFLNQHHIATDAWSLRILWHELATLYSSFIRGEDPKLPLLGTRYADFAARQSKDLQSPQIAKQVEFWRKKLNSVTPLEIPGDFPRPLEMSLQGALYEFKIDSVLKDRLTKFSSRRGTTLFMTTLAAFQTLLARWSGQSDIAVATPVAGRTHADIENLIGFFVNTLVLRTQVDTDLSFDVLLDQVRETTLEAFDHQELPFEKLVDELQPERQRNRNPLAQVLFQVLNFERGSQLELEGLHTERMPIGHDRVRFDLELHLENCNEYLHARAIYSTELFTEVTIKRMMDCYLQLLECIVETADRPIGQIELLSEPQRQQQLLDWNQTSKDFQPKQTLHELFEAQALKSPDAIAVLFADQRVTYRELNERANAIAELLWGQMKHHQENGDDVPRVALGLERGPDFIASILGVLKAGAAWVPLDPDFPESRVQSILEQSQVKAILTQQSQQHRFKYGSTPVCLIENADQSATRNDVPGKQRADETAYVIFTSGSTGKPKGVDVPHRAIFNLLKSMQSILELKPEDRFLGVASPTFDISIAEMFLPLVSGGTAIIVSQDDARSPEVLAEIIEKQQPTFLQATPATWQILCEFGWQGTDATLISTGEALPRPLGEMLLQRGTKLWDLYGPTETTIWSTAQRVTSSADLGSIGRPIHNTQVYILDEHQNPVPVGVFGELYIGGEGLAQGYLEQPELTNEKFVPNPFDETGSSRLYRTGDQVRWSTGGNLECRGRLDNQIKLRGYRIELGEIETVLQQHATVGQCAVLLRTDQPDDPRLVAYVATSTADNAKLKKHLEQRLPNYMVPSAIERLDEFPLTVSGKINRKELPAPTNFATHADKTVLYVSPRNANEKKLAAIWRDVLNLEQIGIHDNFFDLGGHSLLAARMADRANRQFPVRMKLADVFRHPTIAELMPLITQPVPANSSAFAERPLHFASLLKKATSPSVTVVCIGGKVTTLVDKMPESVAVIGLGYDGVQAQPFLGLSIDELAEAYAKEIQQAVPAGPIILAGFCYAGLLAWKTAIVLSLASDRKFEVVLIEPTTAIKPTASQSQQPLAPKKRRTIVDYWNALRHKGYRLRLKAKHKLNLPMSIDERWALHAPHMLNTAREYQSNEKLNQSVHLIAGNRWLERNETFWQSNRLACEPQIHNLGDVYGTEITEHNVPAKAWIDLIVQLVQSTR